MTHNVGYVSVTNINVAKRPQKHHVIDRALNNVQPIRKQLLVGRGLSLHRTNASSCQKIERAQ